MALTALVSVVTTSMYHNRDAKERIMATRQAQEAIEWLRAVRDASGTWEKFEMILEDEGMSEGTLTLDCVTEDMLNNLTTIIDTAAEDCPYQMSGSDFSRQMVISYSDTPSRFVETIVTVSWGSRGGDVEVKGRLDEYQ